ncbi:MAG: hypothetical protein LAN84_15010 [Acidobacteriia bacterium]|nr:hypothetical protein [Terriglobia bacterium]
MKKTGKGGLGHLQKGKKQERQVLPSKIPMEAQTHPRTAKRPHRRMA